MKFSFSFTASVAQLSGIDTSKASLCLTYKELYVLKRRRFYWTFNNQTHCAGAAAAAAAAPAAAAVAVTKAPLAAATTKEPLASCKWISSTETRGRFRYFVL
jgi:pheromone shutdown protein TraB